ncbi:galactose mutarotase-like [Leptopilina heterotoma]|uniref:galactose mutarotase-like n=1 Tax=Leptopilina heterotoma TaxID=63436 RepID=UPI001CA88793|nr:galactose mutarotase-like [Leptopilina heterotoma]
MATDECKCNESTIVEGIFGEILSGSTTKVSVKSSVDDQFDVEGLSTGGGDQSVYGAVKIKSYTMTNSNRMEVVLISWGASIVSLKCPDKFGRSEDIVLGFDHIENYIDPVINQYIGCILGRYCNRIKDGSFIIGGKMYQLSKNDENKHHLHGGVNGFGRQLWNSQIDGCSVIMSYLSDDFEEGYPGALLVTVRFKLRFDNKLEISIRATTTKPTIVNLSYSPYFNLAGHDAGVFELENHKISLNCDRWTFADFSDPVPSGAVRGVGGTIMDLRISQLLGNVMYKVPAGQGYDHNFCVLKSQSGTSFVARALHEKTGRVLEIYSNQQGVQFNTGGRLPPYSFEEKSSDSNFLQSRKESINSIKAMSEVKSAEFGEYIDSENDSVVEKIIQMEIEDDKMSLINNLEFIPGKNGARYKKFCAFSIQPQNYPNAVNVCHFPCSVLRPGQEYSNDIIYKFGVQLANYM